MKAIALDIGDELDVQATTVSDLQFKSDVATEKMEKGEAKMNKALKKLNRSKFFIYLFLSIVLIVELVYLFTLIF
jgi:t-SNARE complex subunit (syntaxin)